MYAPINGSSFKYQVLLNVCLCATGSGSGISVGPTRPRSNGKPNQSRVFPDTIPNVVTTGHDDVGQNSVSLLHSATGTSREQEFLFRRRHYIRTVGQAFFIKLNVLYKAILPLQFLIGLLVLSKKIHSNTYRSEMNIDFLKCIGGYNNFE